MRAVPQVLLSRYSRTEDVVSGTAFANRNRRELEGLYGYFVNSMALRTDLAGKHVILEIVRLLVQTPSSLSEVMLVDKLMMVA